MVGVDPGGRYTGVVTRTPDGVIAARVLTRTTGIDFPDGTYIHEVLDEISKQMEHADAISLEGVVAPSPHVRITNPTGIIGTGIVFGAVIARWPHAIIVPPEGNGSLPDVAYPGQIRRNVRLGGPSTHARSAFDVARAGDLLYRASRSKGGTP